MDGPGATLNDAGQSSGPAPTSSDELVSTVELSPAMDADTPPEGGAKPGAEGEQKPAEGQAAEGKKADGDDGKAAATDDSADRFDKHPRFIELNRRMKAAEDQNRQLLDRIDKLTATQAKPPGDQQLPYRDVSKMTDEEILDWQSEDPKGFLDNINKMIAHGVETGLARASEQSTQASQEREYQARVESTYDAYAKANPDFEAMWDSGDLQKFMEANPGHTAISAHQQLTQEARTQAAIDKAVKEALDKAEAERRSTRKSASILGEGPTRPATTAKSNDEELKTPGRYGGTTSVLASRLARMRAGR